ncbi:hypothetical protein BHE74_00040061 [Ensete ventricosum]|nr:hypothetical protein BHE74_00040061 [Ensete ventricosum]
MHHHYRISSNEHQHLPYPICGRRRLLHLLVGAVPPVASIALFSLLRAPVRATAYRLSLPQTSTPLLPCGSNASRPPFSSDLHLVATVVDNGLHPPMLPSTAPHRIFRWQSERGILPCQSLPNQALATVVALVFSTSAEINDAINRNVIASPLSLAATRYRNRFRSHPLLLLHRYPLLQPSLSPTCSPSTIASSSSSTSLSLHRSLILHEHDSSI